MVKIIVPKPVLTFTCPCCLTKFISDEWKSSGPLPGYIAIACPDCKEPLIQYLPRD